MSKKKNIEVEPDELAAAQTDALADEIVTLQARLEAEIERRQSLEQQVEQLRASMTQVTSSVNIAPPPPMPLARPVVAVNGVTLRFKAGAFVAKGTRYVSEEVAAQPDLLEQIVSNYPGLFEQAD